RFIRQLSVRKWVWVVGSLVQAAAIGGLGLVAFTLTGMTAGWAILGLITVFSLARGFCSVAAKDVLGKTVPKSQRGQLTGWSASAAGLVTLGVGAALLMSGSRTPDESRYALLLAAAAATWIAGAMLYSRIREFAGETEGGGNAISEALDKIAILRTDDAFRRFVIARALLMCSALSAPYYVALGQQRLDSPAWLLGLFVAADGLASLVSGPFWGRFADRSSERVMAVAALVTAGTGITVAVADRTLSELVQTIWFMPLAYFVLSVAHSGVRVGRKTYVVDLASGNRRTDYVSVSNTVIGVLLLTTGVIGAVASAFSITVVIALLATMGLAGAALSMTLPKT
ncbi:MAG: MFS transporter, partial [Woeseiaceae bacterium]|nr:MFS transporter [Woeseiaceae bacterium]